MDSELREILAALLRLPPDKISQVRDLLVSLEVSSGAPAEFMAEVAAFERLRPELRRAYPGRTVAIHGGKVIADGADKMETLGRVLETHGQVACYIEAVDPPAPRRARLPSAWGMR